MLTLAFRGLLNWQTRCGHVTPSASSVLFFRQNALRCQHKWTPSRYHSYFPPPPTTRNFLHRAIAYKAVPISQLSLRALPSASQGQARREFIDHTTEETSPFSSPGAPSSSSETHRFARLALASKPMLLHNATPFIREESVLPMSSPPLAAAAAASELTSQLDDIWEKDLTKVNLPDYVKSNGTTITFPEKVRQQEPSVYYFCNHAIVRISHC